MSRNKAHSRAGIGQRVGQDAFYFEYRDGDTYIRRTIPKSELTAFLTNGIDKDSNIGAGARPIALEPFLRDHYLPKCAVPRLGGNPLSLRSEIILAKALMRTLGKIPIHEIRSAHAEKHKTQRLLQGRGNTTIKKELLLLGRALSNAVSAGLIAKNLMPSVRGLPSPDRSWIWLRREQIESLLDCCSERVHPIIEFLILSGARIGEALLLKNGDIRSDFSAISIPTEKRKRPPREAMRTLKVAHLGPRFGALLSKLRPDPKTGLYFPFSNGFVSDDFAKALKLAGIDELFAETGFHLHDLRGGYCVHRSMVGVAPRQLQYEIGHKNSASIQSYLGRAEQFEPEDSIFFVPVAKSQAAPEPSTATPTHPANPSDFRLPNDPVREIMH